MLKGLVKCHWITAGFVVVGFVIRRLKSISWNNAESVNILQNTYILSQYMRILQCNSKLRRQMTAMITHSFPLVVRVVIISFSHKKSSSFCKFFAASETKKRLKELRQELERIQRSLMFETVIYISDSKLLKNRRRQIQRKRLYPQHAAGINDICKEIIKLLEFDSPKNVVAVILHGPPHTGKTTLADAVYAMSDIDDFKFGKVCLFEEIGSNVDITKLQNKILDQISENENGEHREPESFVEGQISLLMEGLKDHPCFLYIDNVSDSQQLGKLLPERLETCKKLRLLLTSRNSNVCNSLDVPDSEDVKLVEVRSLPSKDTKELNESSADMKHESLETYLQMLLQFTLI